MWVLGGKCPPPTYTINTALHYIKYDANELINSICSLFVWLHVFTGYWNSFFNPSLSEFIWDFECSRCSLLLQTLLAVYSFTVAHCLIGLDFEWRAFRLQKQRPFSWGGGGYHCFPDWQTDPGSVHKPAAKQAPFNGWKSWAQSVRVSLSNIYAFIQMWQCSSVFNELLLWIYCIIWSVKGCNWFQWLAKLP